MSSTPTVTGLALTSAARRMTAHLHHDVQSFVIRRHAHDGTKHVRGYRLRHSTGLCRGPQTIRGDKEPHLPSRRASDGRKCCCCPTLDLWSLGIYAGALNDTLQRHDALAFGGSRFQPISLQLSCQTPRILSSCSAHCLAYAAAAARHGRRPAALLACLQRLLASLQ